MKIYIYSPQFEIAELLADNLSSSEDFVIAFSDFSHLYETVKNSTKYPDLLILDYLLYNHENFSITENLNEKKIFLPVVWYNDPCIVGSTRVIHWKAEIEMLQCHDKKRDLSYLDNILEKLQNLIESEEIRPYIALMQPPLPLPEKYIKRKMTLEYIRNSKSDYIDSFKERVKLPNNLFYLLKILQENSPIPMSLEDILEEYKNDGKNMTKASLQALISKLRNIIRKDKDCNFLINYDEKRYRFVVYKG